MTERVFVDTNIWVYAVDVHETAKQAAARAVLASGGSTDLVTSAQVLGEFYVTVTRKLGRPVTPGAARGMVREMARLQVVAIDADLVEAALAISRDLQVSYWDALIVASAQAASCGLLLTEDLSNGATYGGVRVRNPFIDQPRIAETAASYGSRRDRWTDDDLLAELGRYEAAAHESGMRPNAIHSYWDYARRFLAWRVGEYRPRGTTATGRPVSSEPVTGADLEAQAAAYARAIEAAGRERPTVDTYHRHAMFFIRWLRSEFEPGARLR
jgi:predicted nucleic acid-binding protein